MKFLIAVFLPASPFIPTSPFINFGDFCQPPNPSRLLFWPKFASLSVYSVLPFYLKLESTTLTNSKWQWEYRRRSQFFSYANKGSWVCVKVRKMKSRMKFLAVTFFISDYIIRFLCIQKQSFGIQNNRNLFEIKI